MKNLCLLLALFSAGMSRAALLYDLSLPNPPTAFANLDPGVIMMDDVLIPVSRLNGQPRISITRIETKIYIAQPGTYTIEAWISKARVSGGVLQPEFPLTRLISNTATYTVPNQVRNITLVPTIGTEVASLPTLPLNYQGNDYGVIFFGMSFSAALDRIGWVVANGPDFNIDAFWGHYGPGDPRNGPKSLFDNRASFNLRITGTPVPEPGIAMALGSGLVAALGYRRRRAGRGR